MYCNGLDPRAENQLFRGHLAKTEVEFDFPKQEVGWSTTHFHLWPDLSL